MPSPIAPQAIMCHRLSDVPPDFAFESSTAIKGPILTYGSIATKFYRRARHTVPLLQRKRECGMTPDMAAVETDR